MSQSPSRPGERVAALNGISAKERAQLAFLAVRQQLTSVVRANYVADGSRGETTAEHSWHVCLCALTLGPNLAPGVDLERVLAMLCLHDLAEVEVGDTPIYDDAARAVAAKSEREVAEVMFDGVDDGKLLAIWHEFHRSETHEAKFANGIDRFQPIFLHWIGGGLVWRWRGTQRSEIQTRVEKVRSYWPQLGDLAEIIVEDADHRRDFATD